MKYSRCGSRGNLRPRVSILYADCLPPRNERFNRRNIGRQTAKQANRWNRLIPAKKAMCPRSVRKTSSVTKEPYTVVVISLVLHYRGRWRRKAVQREYIVYERGQLCNRRDFWLHAWSQNYCRLRGIYSGADGSWPDMA